MGITGLTIIKSFDGRRFDIEVLCYSVMVTIMRQYQISVLNQTCNQSPTESNKSHNPWRFDTSAMVLKHNHAILPTCIAIG